MHSPEEPSAPPAHKPYVPDEASVTEMTVRGIVVGSILGIIFAASSVYLGLKVGLTVSASIPIAVLSITIFRLFGRPTILENNIVQTTGSAGESIAAGVAFTLPSLLLMGFDLDLVRVTLVALLGGALGVLMMIPLRQGLIVKEHGKLPYPEGTACAQVLIVGEKGGTSAKTVFGGFGAGALFSIVGLIGKFWGEYANWSFGRWFKGGSFSFETSPALLGVGYIIGTRTSCIMMAGGMLSFLVLIPAIHVFGPEMFSPLVKNGGVAVKDMSPGDIRNGFILYIGAGAVAAGGLITLARSLPTIVSAFRRGFGNISTKGRAAPRRTENDLSMKVVLFGSAALVLAIAFARPLGVNWLSAILIVLFGFFFVTVSSRITGEIGSSSNPISGMTVATLLITCLLFVLAKWTGVSYKEMALCTAALVCVAASNGGTISQDLKTGYIVGATPKHQQVAIMWGVLTSALVIGWTLIYLNDTATTYAARAYPEFTANDATVQAGEKDHFFFSPETKDFRGQSFRVFYVRSEVKKDEKTILVPRGKYLVGPDAKIAYLVDPGVCGTEKEQKGLDGKVEKTVAKFDAPKARLFQIIIDGVLEQDLPWGLVLIGVFIAIMMELCGVPALPFAVGAYLPLSTSTSIFLGGAVRYLVEKRRKMTPEEAESSPGVLFSSGLIAGGAIAGIFSAVLADDKTTIDAAGNTTMTTLLEYFHLDLARLIFNKDAAHFLDSNPWWSIAPFLLLAFLLFKVAGGSRSSASRK